MFILGRNFVSGYPRTRVLAIKKRLQ